MIPNTLYTLMLVLDTDGSQAVMRTTFAVPSTVARDAYLAAAKAIRSVANKVPFESWVFDEVRAAEVGHGEEPVKTGVLEKKTVRGEMWEVLKENPDVETPS
jgi:hypothetical protein